MAGTVIDQLVVTLGLNAKGFKAGTDSAKQGLSNLSGGVSEAGESILGLATKLGTLTAAVIGIGDLFGYFKHLAESMLPLHMMAQNLGIDEKQLLIWGQAAQIAGGQTGDAVASINSLQQALFNLRFKGQFSEQLVMLQRLGVQFMTTGGRMRDFNAIAMDTARALQRAGFDQATRYQFALSAGFTGGVATAVSQGPSQLQDYLAKATNANKSVTDRQIDAIAKLDQSLLLLRDKVDANSLALLDHATPAINALTAWLEKALGFIVSTVEKTFGPGSTLARMEAAFGKEAKPYQGFGSDILPALAAAQSILPEPEWKKKGEPSPIQTALNWLYNLGNTLGSLSPAPSAGGANGTVSAAQWMPPSLLMPSIGMGQAAASVDIGTINIYTKATDATGIAAQIKPAIQRKFATGQADRGVTP